MKIWIECEYKYKQSVTDFKVGEDCPELSSGAEKFNLDCARSL